MISASTLVLLITGIIGLIGFGLMILIILQSTIEVPPNEDEDTPPAYICGGTDIESTTPAPAYARITPKSVCNTPLATGYPPFVPVEHTVGPSSRIRSLDYPLSPNHWIAGAAYNTQANSIINVYPYYAQITPTSLVAGWPGTGTIGTACYSGITGTTGATGTCPPNSSDITYSTSMSNTISISTLEETVLSCDIVDFDACTATVVWQNQSSVTDRTGSLTIPLVKGSPYITIVVNNSGLSLALNQTFTISSADNITYNLALSSTTGYMIYLSRNITIPQINNVMYVPPFTGTVRLAYYNTTAMRSVLNTYYNTYPITSTISTSNTGVTGATGTYDVNTTITWNTQSMGATGTSVLMAMLPHHNITNIMTQSAAITNTLINPCWYITTTNNAWILSEILDIDPSYIPNTSPAALTVFSNDMTNIMNIAPEELSTVEWCQYVGSIATLILIGNSLSANTSSLVNLLNQQLSMLQMNNGVIYSSMNTFVYDTTWGGIIGQDGLGSCTGMIDYGNAFYQNHIGQYGYLIYASAVLGQINSSFLNNNLNTILAMVRDVANPYEFDEEFPLWRNKDYYTGYSIATGLVPQTPSGKWSYEMGGAILGYYGCLLLGQVIGNSTLTQWSLSLLSTEIAAVQTYFQFRNGNNSLIVNPAFNTTISSRSDNSYAYKAISSINYPARNAIIMMSLVKPLTLISTSYINNNWAINIAPVLNSALSDTEMDADAYGYSNALLGNSTSNKVGLLDNIADASTVPLSYGSVWSEMYYYINNI
jgi:endo-1,3(4)-beta-glucanase